MVTKEKIKILAIIPAKLDSTRLPNKNIQSINGKSLIEHSIDYAKACSHDIDILVSSESLLVKEITDKCGVQFHLRSKHLCGDAEVVDVYIDIVNNILPTYDLVVGLQPDNPDREHTLDTCINYMIVNKYDDLITINPKYKRSGSVRIFKYDYLLNSKVSKRIGCIKDNATDIHYKEDLESIKLK